jgi:hypothetical protein
MTDAESWRDYQEGMLEIARLHAPVLAARVPVPKGATSLLDVAGSHGLLGAAICRRHPPMRATVLDLPQALAHARAIGRDAGLQDVVRWREGDLLTADYGEGHGVVLLANILHHFTGDRIQSILERSHTALEPGGTVAIWEVEAPSKKGRATSGDGAALFFKLTSTAGAYSGDQYADWLRGARFSKVAVARPALAPGYVLVNARR